MTHTEILSTLFKETMEIMRSVLMSQDAKIDNLNKRVSEQARQLESFKNILENLRAHRANDAEKIRFLESIITEINISCAVDDKINEYQEKHIDRAYEERGELRETSTENSVKIARIIAEVVGIGTILALILDRVF